MEKAFKGMGLQLKAARISQGITQAGLSKRTGKNQARISELERDLIHERSRHDRLALLAELCDALGLIPILVPRARYSEVSKVLRTTTVRSKNSDYQNTAFEDVFVDLTNDEDN